MKPALVIAALLATAAPLATGRLAGAATITLEIATEPGVQITAPQQWLQLLAELKVTGVRVRSARPGDHVEIEADQGQGSPRYRVYGLLSASDRLNLPGGAFARQDRQGLRDYFDRLRADGVEGVTAERGRFGLTRKQFETVFQALSKKIDFSTKKSQQEDFVQHACKLAGLPVILEREARLRLRPAETPPEEMRGLAIGTALAIALRQEGLSLLPEKPRGAAPQLRIAIVSGETESWPVGYKPDASTRQVAPKMMERIQVEIDGYSLAEAIAAIAPRLALPIHWDRRSMKQAKIDPATKQVQLARTRTYYKRILDKLLFQARLQGQLRTDEAGTVFFWISR